jgi:nucleoid-associated protein YgaU
MADLEQFKQKYASVLQLIKTRNVRLDHLHVQDGKLVMQGAAPNEDVKNEVWNAIKAVDPGYSDLSADISIDSSLPAPAAAAQKYTVRPGDSLSKIAKQFYGDANSYMRIFEANRDQLSDPNKIQPGQELSIPAA